MVDSENFKKTIRNMISQEYELEFLGDNFDKIVNLLSESKADNIYEWIKEVIERKTQPITIGSKKKYKEWQLYNLLTFKYPFKLENTEYRVVLIKVKNSFYIEFHLSDHKYYDKLRKKLDLTKKNY